MNQDRALNDILVDEGYVTRDVLHTVLAGRADTRESVVDVLVRQGAITPQQKLKCIGLQTGIPFVDVRSMEVDSRSARLLPQKTCARLKLLIIEASDTCATVAMSNALDLEAIDEISQDLNRDVDPVWALEQDISEKMVEVFGAFNDLEDLLGNNSGLDEDIEVTSGEVEDNDHVIALGEGGEGSPVVQFVNGLFIRAIRMRTSDIHIQPDSKGVKVKFRIDGVLRDIMEIPKDVHRAVVSRIKVLSGLDIAERRVPQDGRCSLVSTEGEYDFRVATYPSVNGEKVTIRVLDKSRGIVPVEKLGIESDSEKRLLWAAEQSQGLVLVTGPTGSGKTTTLYALLRHLNEGDRQIITIEDPAEYQMDGIVQANVNKAAGMTFAAGLRAILRADPDVILVGESRDPETAKTSIEAALTGHLVLTSLHSNDSAAAITRLVEMGVEEFLVAASVTCSVAQRLVRCNCPNCSEPYKPDPEILERLQLPKDGQYKKGVGCDTCGGTGYKGRMGVYEVLSVTGTIQKMILAGESNVAIRDKARELGMKTLIDDAAAKAAAGLTTVEEVARVVAAEDRS
ncbi:MAG: GspE/PulE family protein [Armatimonadetes bacterium]|nr:GspE/PulE family protein [Armatimonadota bacterium]